MNRKIGVLLIFITLALSFASAEIFLSKQPSDIYSLGDSMQITLGSDGEEGWANINLICQNKTKMIYFHYLTKKETSSQIAVPLTKTFLRDMMGECYLSLIYGNQTKQSMKFKILESLDLSVILNKNEFLPNETIFISGTASKPNKQLVNGFAEISIQETELQTIVPIDKNKFAGNITLPEQTAGGKYTIKIFVYEKENNEITNNGLANFSVSIAQRPQGLAVTCPSEINPGDNLEFTAKLYDQAGLIINAKPVSFKIVASDGNELLNTLSETDKPNYLKLQKNTPKGYMNLSVQSENLLEGAQIYVNENKEALFNLVNNTLIITNIGNVPYDKMVEISIGNYSEVKNLNLSVGGAIEFDLKAPDGEYSILVSDGQNEFAETAMLTGNAIAIGGGRPFSLAFFNKTSIVWIFLILVFAMFIFVSARRTLKGKMILSMDKLRFRKNKEQKYGNLVKVVPQQPALKQGNAENYKPLIGSPAPFIPVESNASYTLVSDGQKQQAALIALKIKNMEELKQSKSNAQDTIEDSLKEITNSNGKIYRMNDVFVGIFAPSITKTFDNTFRAVRVATNISERLRQHNSKFMQKILFGIGVNSGDIVAKKEQGKLLFTPLGSALMSAKRTAEIANNELLISEEANKKLMSKAKTVANPDKFGTKTYSLKEITDTQENKKFIDSFLKRNRDVNSRSMFD